MSDLLKRPSPVAFIIPVALIAWSIFRLKSGTPSTFWKVAFIGLICLASIDVIIKLIAVFMGGRKTETKEGVEEKRVQRHVEDLEDRSAHS